MSKMPSLSEPGTGPSFKSSGFSLSSGCKDSEARAHDRKFRNKISSQKSRDHQKARLLTLERRVGELEEENRNLRGVLDDSQRVIAALFAQQLPSPTLTTPTTASLAFPTAETTMAPPLPSPLSRPESYPHQSKFSGGTQILGPVESWDPTRPHSDWPPSFDENSHATEVDEETIDRLFDELVVPSSRVSPGTGQGMN
ncbi:hypothetical protein B0H14DRAFT_3162296 [Mycena olivaceomarginata]|nr:hypothetical protein B0H14DRAFT_3162296 [Mycena olivaceomarginata]